MAARKQGRYRDTDSDTDIQNKIWCVGYKDFQKRSRNKWFNCRDYVDPKDPEEDREKQAMDRCMNAAIAW